MATDTPSLADLKAACGLLTGIVIGTRYPDAHRDALPPESFHALVVAIRRLELAAQQTRQLPEEPAGGGHRFVGRRRGQTQPRTGPAVVRVRAHLDPGRAEGDRV